MNSEHPKEPLTERCETLSARRQTTDKLRTRPSNGAYVQHWVWGLTQWTTQVLNELLSTEWPNEPLWKKKKDKLAFSVYKLGHNLQRRLSMHFEKTKDLQNHCFVLLTDLQTIGSIYRWGKTPAGRGMQAAAMFSSSSPRPSTSKQSAKMNATTSETLYRLWAGDTRFLFPTLCPFPLPLHPDWGPPAPGGGCVILCHKEKTMRNHGNSARIPKPSTLGM